MRLDEVHDLIRTTGATDWHLVEGPGQTFLDTLAVTTFGIDDDAPWRLDIDGHHSRAPFRGDVSLGLAWGLDYEGGRTWKEPWATFPDEEVRGFWADILYNGMLIGRNLLASVDGGRCYLPMPHPIVDTDGAAPTVTGQRVSTFEYNVARLIDGIGRGTSEFDTYFAQTGIQIIDV